MSAKTCRSRSFKAFMIAQFISAFNDNAFKIVVILFALRTVASSASGMQLVSLTGAIFLLPFVLFVSYAGYCADRFGKRKTIIISEVAEVIIMVLGLCAFATGNVSFLIVVIFLLGVQSTFFSPAMYSIMPEMLAGSELSRGNGFLHMWTFLAIILGTAFGGQLAGMAGESIVSASFIFIALALIGAISSFFITEGYAVFREHKFEINFVKDIVGTLKTIKKDKPLFLVLLAVAYFWFFGAIFQLNAILYGKEVLHLSDASIGILLTVTAVGVAAGSVLAGKMSEGHVELGIVPIGSIGLSLFGILLGLEPYAHSQGLIRLFLLGVSGGIFFVPLNAFFQQRSPKEMRGKFLAVFHIVNAFAMLCGALFIWLMGVLFGCNAAQVFLLLGVASIGVTAYALYALPDALLRLINWIITHSLYKVRVVGRENVPTAGGALLVCNHVSFMDPPLVFSSIERPIRYLTYRPIYENRFLHPIFKIMHMIPIAFHDPPKVIVRALNEARATIEKGELVCIFAEGGLTRTGNMLPFNKGFEHIMKGVDVPIIPVHIDAIWGSIFSFKDDKYIWKMPKHIPYPVTISYGKPLPSNAKTYEVRQAVQELGAEAFRLRGKYQHKLHIAFMREAKRHFFRFCMADSTGLKLTYGKLLTSMMLISQKLFPRRRDASGEPEMVGILLPATCMAAVVNGAILFAGKIPVNLNFTAAKESLAAAIQQCSIRKIITSRKFLEKVKIEARSDMIFLEDFAKTVKTWEKPLTFLKALLLPSFFIRAFYIRGDKRNMNDIATVIFSSGSTGEPKGAMLSHGNIFSNVEGLYQVFHIRKGDIIMGVLPFFHSFGFTAALCLPLGAGISVVYHPNPLDAATVGRLVARFQASIIIGTPTFLSTYTRKCKREQFESIRYAAAGAEKLKQSIADDFYEKFKVIPFEGYGATELSPVVSMGFADYINKAENIHQVAYKAGTVGHPIPGVATKIVDPDSFAVRGVNEEGLLLIKGPNVMQGYLNNPEKTKEVIKDGWYVTGDIAMIDDDGFIRITDRLSRFSKIGGEMVPHVRVEEEITDIISASEAACVVTAVSDEKKGERLAVLYKGELNIDEVWEKLNARSLPKLWLPRREDFYPVEDLPLLGSGKLDLKQLKYIAGKRASAVKQ